MNQLIIHLSEASIQPSICSSINPFLLFILGLNLSDDICLLFCLYHSSMLSALPSIQTPSLWSSFASRATGKTMAEGELWEHAASCQ